MFYPVKAFGYLPLVEPSVITSEIARDPTETLYFRVAAHRAVVFNLSLITAFQTGVNGEIEREIRDVQRHRVVDDVLDRLRVLHYGTLEFDIGYATGRCVFAERGFRFKLFLYGNLLPYRHMVGVGKVLPICYIFDFAKFRFQGAGECIAERLCGGSVTAKIEVVALGSV